MFAAPPVIETKILVDINAAFGITDRQSEWAKLLFGRPNTPSFLEGPSFDRDGNLWLVDVAWGRLFGYPRQVPSMSRASMTASPTGWPSTATVTASLLTIFTV